MGAETVHGNDSGGGADGGKLENLLRLPKHAVMAHVPEGSPAYQRYLAANKALELAREEEGYVTAEALAELRAAVKAVQDEARLQLAGDRANP